MNEDIFQRVRLGDVLDIGNLIRKGLNINIQNEEGQNLLQEAIAFKNQPVAQNLIFNGIDLNHKDLNGQTALHYCCVYNNIEICQLLVNSINIEVNLKDNYGNNPLWTAVFNARLIRDGNYSILEMLLNKGGDVHSMNNAGRSPASFASQINIKEIHNVIAPYL